MKSYIDLVHGRQCSSLDSVLVSGCLGVRVYVWVYSVVSPTAPLTAAKELSRNAFQCLTEMAMETTIRGTVGL